MKLIGIACIALVCACIGVMVSRRIREETQYVERLAMLLEDLRIYIHYQSLPLDELLTMLSAHCSYRDFAFLRKTQAGFSGDGLPMELWCDAVREDPCVIPEAGEILCSLGTVLGATDTEGQLSALEAHAVQMRRLSAETKERNGKRAALSCQLGVLGGAMLAVLLL